MQWFLILLAYIVGAIPSGYWFGRYVMGIDITCYGSGNIGASNVARVLGKRYFLLIFCADALKAYGMMIFAGYYLDPQQSTALYPIGAALLIGNAFSPFLRFKGGKGVATAIGIAAYYIPFTMLLFTLVCWLIIVAITRHPFVASLAWIALAMLCDYYYQSAAHAPLFVCIALWLVMRHTTNIYRLFKKDDS